jgi:hypothetical protein
MEQRYDTTDHHEQLRKQFEPSSWDAYAQMERYGNVHTLFGNVL